MGEETLADRRILCGIIRALKFNIVMELCRTSNPLLSPCDCCSVKENRYLVFLLKDKRLKQLGYWFSTCSEMGEVTDDEDDQGILEEPHRNHHHSDSEFSRSETFFYIKHLHFRTRNKNAFGNFLPNRTTSIHFASTALFPISTMDDDNKKQCACVTMSVLE